MAIAVCLCFLTNAQDLRVVGGVDVSDGSKALLLWVLTVVDWRQS